MNFLLCFLKLSPKSEEVKISLVRFIASKKIKKSVLEIGHVRFSSHLSASTLKWGPP